MTSSSLPPHVLNASMMAGMRRVFARTVGENMPTMNAKSLAPMCFVSVRKAHDFARRTFVHPRKPQPVYGIRLSFALTHTRRRQTLSRQASRGLVGAGVVAAGVSAVASAGGLTSAGVAATAMVPRGARGIHKTLKAVEWAVGMSVVAVSVADGVSSLVTRSRGGRPGQTEEAGGVCA